MKVAFFYYTTFRFESLPPSIVPMITKMFIVIGVNRGGSQIVAFSSGTNFKIAIFNIDTTILALLSECLA